jgi:hypothetical protein
VATAPNLGTGGTALDAQFGSSSTSNTNEPLLLAHSGTNYLYLPGATGNYASAPDSAALSITGDIDIKAWVALDDWTPAATAFVVAKWNTTGNQRSYYLAVLTSGELRLITDSLGTGGAGQVSGTSTVATGVTDRSAKWIRATLDVDNGAGSRVYKFYLSDNGTAWTQLGTTVTTAGTTSIFDSTALLEIGSFNSGSSGNVTGAVYRAIIQNAYDTADNTSNIVFDANFTTGITSGAQATFAESSSNAATVTINRASGSSGRKAVAVVRPVWLLGADDFFEVADNDLIDFGLTDPFTVWVVYRNWSTIVRNVALVSKKQDTGVGTVGWYLYQLDSGPQATAMISDGTNRPYVDGGNVGSAGVARMSAMVRDVATDNIIAYSRVGSAGLPANDNTTASIANALAMRIGRAAGAGTSYADIELIAAGVHRRALSATELAQIATYYGVA